MKTTNPKDYTELLEVFNIALVNGLLNKTEVVKWADKIVANDDEPDIFFIELSLCGNKSINDMVSLINEQTQQVNPQVSTRAIFALLYNQYNNGLLTINKVRSTIWWLINGEDITDYERYFIQRMEIEFDCVDFNRSGSIKEAEKKMLEFLEIYKELQIENFADWKRINETIDVKLDLLEVAEKKAEAESLKKKWWQFW